LRDAGDLSGIEAISIIVRDCNDLAMSCQPDYSKVTELFPERGWDSLQPDQVWVFAFPLGRKALLILVDPPDGNQVQA